MLMLSCTFVCCGLGEIVDDNADNHQAVLVLDAELSGTDVRWQEVGLVPGPVLHIIVRRIKMMMLEMMLMGMMMLEMMMIGMANMDMGMV